MTSLQKAFVVTVLIVAAGAAVYEAHRASLWQAQAQAQLLEKDSLAAALQKERADAANRAATTPPPQTSPPRDDSELAKSRAQAARLRAAEQELARLRASATARDNDPAMAALRPLLDSAKKLEENLAQKPDRWLPEFQFLTDQDWFDAVGKAGKLETDADFDKAISALRIAAKNDFAAMTQTALRAYAQANNGQPPTDMPQLKPYFGTAVDDSVLQRYQLGDGGTVAELAAPQDAHDEVYYQIGPNSINSSSRDEDALQPAVAAFSAANNGQAPNDPRQLAPYIKTPAEQAALQSLLQKP